jgi:regulatory protein YycI of two-component signal transduction system YycFG
MKTCTINIYKNLFCLFNEDQKLVGELLNGFIKKSIKIGKEIYKIKNTGFFWSDLNIFDKNNQLVLRSDASKNRLFHYSNYTGFYTYKGLSGKKVCLFDNDDNQVILIDRKENLFSTEYKIEIQEGFNNYLVILSFLYLYLRNSSGE